MAPKKAASSKLMPCPACMGEGEVTREDVKLYQLVHELAAKHGSEDVRTALLEALSDSPDDDAGPYTGDD